jgi:MinD-like ATPase involved in chromosome partitioning or flagellar assembly
MTALALGTAWGGDVAVADLDPVGGDVLWRTRDVAGEPLDPDHGMLSLAAAARRGATETTLADHLQDCSLGFPVLAGVPTPEQLAGLGSVWTQLPQIFSSYAGDVLVDLGRVVPGSASLPVLLQADAVVFVVRPDIEGVAQLRTRLRGLADALGLDHLGASRVGVAVVTSYRDTAVAGDLQRLLDAERLKVRVLGIVATDPKGARILRADRVGDPRKTLLVRSARSLTEQVRALVGDRSRAEVL